MAIRAAFNDLKTKADDAPGDMDTATEDPMEDDVSQATMQAVRFIEELVENSFPEALAKRAWQAKITDVNDGVCAFARFNVHA